MGDEAPSQRLHQSAATQPRAVGVILTNPAPTMGACMSISKHEYERDSITWALQRRGCRISLPARNRRAPRFAEPCANLPITQKSHIIATGNLRNSRRLGHAQDVTEPHLCRIRLRDNRPCNIIQPRTYGYLLRPQIPQLNTLTACAPSLPRNSSVMRNE